MTKYESYKKDVLQASQWLFEHGYFGSQRGSGGNVSIRVDETMLAVTPSSVKYTEMTVEDIYILDFGLAVIEGKPAQRGMYILLLIN